MSLPEILVAGATSAPGWSNLNVNSIDVKGIPVAPRGGGQANGVIINNQGVTDSTGSFGSTSTLAVSITPSSTSSKILILVQGTATTAGSSIAYYLSLTRGGTEVTGSNAGILSNTVSTGAFQNASFQYIDSPASTANQTYAVVIRTGTGSTQVSFGATSSTAGQGRIYAIEL